MFLKWTGRLLILLQVRMGMAGMGIKSGLTLREPEG